MPSIISIRKVLAILAEDHRKKMALVILLSILQSGLEILSLGIVVPLLYKLTGADLKVSHTVLSLINTLEWQTILSVIVVVFIVKNFICLLIIRNQSNYLSAVSVSLSERLYRKFYNQSWTGYIENNSAETIRKIKITPDEFSGYILQGYITLLTDGFTCLLMTTAIVLYDYRVVAIMIILCLPVTLLYLFIRKRIIGSVNKSFREAMPKASIILTQGIDSFAEGRIYHKENYFIGLFMRIRLLMSRQLADLKTATTIPSRLFELTTILCICALIYYAKTTTLNTSNLVVLLGLLLIAMYQIIPSLNRMLIALSQMEAHTYTVSELQNSFQTSEPQPDVNEPITFSNKIEFQGISYQYNTSTWILKNLNITVTKGDFVVIEGSSGAGKTTLLYLVARLLTPREGKILIDGIALTPVNSIGFQNMIGFVPQSPVILQDTISRNIAFGDEQRSDLNKINNVLNLSCLQEFIDLLPAGIETQIGENGLNLSGGQRQRLTLARALYRDPEILLLDEVTNQLDEHTKEQVLKNLKSLCAAGKTVILSTHDPFARDFATQILKM